MLVLLLSVKINKLNMSSVSAQTHIHPRRQHAACGRPALQPYMILCAGLLSSSALSGIVALSGIADISWYSLLLLT
jgi:hypothetical protein